MAEGILLSSSIFFMWKPTEGGKQLERVQTYSADEATKLWDKAWRGIEINFPPHMTIRTWLPIKYDMKSTAAHAVIWRENAIKFLGFYPAHPDTMMLPVGDRTDRLTYFCLMEVTKLAGDESIMFNGQYWFVISMNPTGNAN